MVEALDVVGFACLFRDGFVTLSGDDTLVHFILIGMKYGVVLIGLCRKFCSEGHDGAVAPVCAEITRRESRTIRPQ